MRDSDLAEIIARLESFAILQVMLGVGLKSRFRVKLVKLKIFLSGSGSIK